MSLTAPIGCSQASNRHARRTWMVAWRPDPPRSPGIRHDQAEVPLGYANGNVSVACVVACVVDPERGGSGHRRVTLRHVPWRWSARQRRSPTFGDIDACRLVPIRRAHPVPTGGTLGQRPRPRHSTGAAPISDSVHAPREAGPVGLTQLGLQDFPDGLRGNVSRNSTDFGHLCANALPTTRTFASALARCTPPRAGRVANRRRP